MKLGRYPWLNCLLPYFCIEKGIFAGVEPVTGYPRDLTQMLIERKISATPVPSFLYFKNKNHISISPGFSITSKGKVMSVILTSERYNRIFKGARIGVSGYSTTSYNLLKIILAEMDMECSIEYMPSNKFMGDYDFVLWIGDDALNHTDKVVMDLGEEWFRIAGKPMVFAVLCGMNDAGEIMRKSVECGRKKIQEIVNIAVRKYGYQQEFIEEYLRCLRYGWGREEEKGLREFEERCREYKLI